MYKCMWDELTDLFSIRAILIRTIFPQTSYTYSHFATSDEPKKNKMDHRWQMWIIMKFNCYLKYLLKDLFAFISQALRSRGIGLLIFDGHDHSAVDQQWLAIRACFSYLIMLIKKFVLQFPELISFLEVNWTILCKFL